MGDMVVYNNKSPELVNWNHRCKVDLAFKTTFFAIATAATFAALIYAYSHFHSIITEKKWSKLPEYVPFAIYIALGILLQVKKTPEDSAASLDVAEGYMKPISAAIIAFSWTLFFPITALNEFFDKRAYYLSTVRTETANNLENNSFVEIAKAYGHRGWGATYTSDWENLIHYGFIKDNATVEVNGTHISIREWLKTTTSKVIEARKSLTELEADMSEATLASVEEYGDTKATIQEIENTWNRIKGEVCNKFSVSRLKEGRREQKNLLEKYFFETRPRVRVHANAPVEEV